MATKLNLVVECRESQKGGSYQVLKVDLGYTERFLTFDRATISEITNITLGDLAKMGVGTAYSVGYIVFEDK